MKIELSPRLSAAASLVRGGGVLADIGTDHGYLPVYLVQKGVITSAIAADIGKLPLENARQTVKKYGLEEKIALRLSDGLNAFSETEVAEIVFAGMGGTLIAEKLSEIPWVKNKSLHFIFQPQSRAEELRAFLFDNGFEICEETAVCEGKRCYIAFDAVYTGVKKSYKYSDCFLGKLPKTPESEKHISHQLCRMQKKYDALILKGETEETVRLLKLITDLKDFLND